MKHGILLTVLLILFFIIFSYFYWVLISYFAVGVTNNHYVYPIGTEGYKRAVFMTYGDERFKKSRERLAKEAKQLGIFDECVIETKDSLKRINVTPGLKVVMNKKRGGGYWTWKPLLIYENLKKLEDGDILVYADAGCSIKESSKRDMIRYVNATSRSNSGILATLMKKVPDIRFWKGSFVHDESAWTKGDIFAYFNAHHLKDTQQYESSRIFIRKCPHSMKLIKNGEIRPTNTLIYSTTVRPFIRITQISKKPPRPKRLFYFMQNDGCRFGVYHPVRYIIVDAH